MKYRIRVLQKSDNREEFNSGNEDLDHFFKRYAGQNQFKHHIGVSYVAADDDKIFGYITVAMGSIEAEEAAVRKGLPAHYPLSVLRIGRLAVDSRFQGRGIGKQLLRHAFLLAIHQRDTVGCVGVVVDAKNEAVDFYKKLGFVVIDGVVEGQSRATPARVPMFVGVKSIG